jgi:hypothetical protein
MSILTWFFVLLLLGGVGYMAVAYACTRMEERKYRGHTGGSLFYRRGKVPWRAHAYRAVELKLCHDPCEAALVIAGKRLLKSEAPALPLAECKHKKCKCRYIQYDDRRFEQRRGASPYGGPTGGAKTKEERRKPGVGRRTVDKTGGGQRK